jgi:hypothetical protein
LSCNNISCIEIVTVLWRKFINLFRNKFPIRFISWLLVFSFFKKIFFFIERTWNASFVFCVLKIYNCVWLDLISTNVILISTMLNKFPKTFALIFVNDWSSLLVRFLYTGPDFHVIITCIILSQTSLIF